MINDLCRDCHWNHFPECHGTISKDGSYLNIEKGISKLHFKCGQKNRETVKDFRIGKTSIKLKNKEK